MRPVVPCGSEDQFLGEVVGRVKLGQPGVAAVENDEDGTFCVLNDGLNFGPWLARIIATSAMACTG